MPVTSVTLNGRNGWKADAEGLDALGYIKLAREMDNLRSDQRDCPAEDGAAAVVAAARQFTVAKKQVPRSARNDKLEGQATSPYHVSLLRYW